MLISLVLSPALLRPSRPYTESELNGLWTLLKAVERNAVVIVPTKESFRAALGTSAQAITGRYAQRLQILAADLLKLMNRCVVSPPVEGDGTAAIEPIAQMVAIVEWGAPDAVIALDAQDAAACIEAGVSADAVVLLSEYPLSEIEQLRDTWRETCRLDTMEPAVALNIVGRMVKFCTSILAADKMFARSTTNDKKKSQTINKHLNGLIYLDKAWRNCSPYARHRTLDIDIITVAGSMSDNTTVAAGTAFDEITVALQRLGLKFDDRKGNIVFKREASPPVFNKRILQCGRRAFAVEHGFDDLGALLDASQAHIEKAGQPKRATELIPASEAAASVLREVLNLRTADARSLCPSTKDRTPA